MMRRFPIPRPTENQAIGRTSRRSSPSATVQQLRGRLVVAVQTDDGHGARLLAHLVARAV